MSICETVATHVPAERVNEELKPGTGVEYARSFFEEFFGEELVGDLKSAFSTVPDEVAPLPYASMSECGDAFMHSAFASPIYLLTIILAFVAGAVARIQRKTAGWLVTLGVAISLFGLASGTSRQMLLSKNADFAGSYELAIYDYLPLQIFANTLFQIAIPFFLGVTLALVVGAAHRLAEFTPVSLNRKVG